MKESPEAQEAAQERDSAYGRFERRDDTAPTRVDPAGVLAWILIVAAVSTVVGGFLWGVVYWWQAAHDERAPGHHVAEGDQLSIGDCVLLTDDEVVAGFEVLPCEETHDAQVFAVFEIESADQQSLPVLQARSLEGCRDRRSAAQAMAPDGARLTLTTFVPEATISLRHGWVVSCLFIVRRSLPG